MTVGPLVDCPACGTTLTERDPGTYACETCGREWTEAQINAADAGLVDNILTGGDFDRE